MSEELKFASEEEALQHLADITGKKIKVGAVDSGIQELLTHHFNEIKRLKKVRI